MSRRDIRTRCSLARWSRGHTWCVRSRRVIRRSWRCGKRAYLQPAWRPERRAAAAGQAAALAPDYPEVHATLALLHHCRADTDQAYEHYTQFQLLSLRAGDGYDGDLTRRLAEGEALMVLLVNSERRTRGLPLLSPELRLTEMARQHSDEMRDLGYFSHESPLRRNRDLGERFQRAFGHAAQALAENLSRMRGTLWCFTPEHLRDSHNRLMASTGHRANILWDRPTHIGVGIAVSPRGDYWITENFALIDR